METTKKSEIRKFKIADGHCIDIAGFLPHHCFMSDFLSFIVVEHIRFFHGALQFCK